MYPYFDATTWITPYGLFFLAGVTLAWFLGRRNAASAGVEPSHVDLLMPIALSAGVLGGGALALLGSSDDGMRVQLFAVVGIGALSLWIYSYFARLSFRRLLDIFALPVLAALAVHRIGCFLAGCCWGDIVSGEFIRGVQYPPGSFAYEQHLDAGLMEPGAAASLPVHAVQLYESGLLLILLLLLSRVPWRRMTEGSIAVIAISSYAVLRFFMEFMRADNEVLPGGFTTIQIVCIVLLFSAMLLVRSRRAG